MRKHIIKKTVRKNGTVAIDVRCVFCGKVSTVVVDHTSAIRWHAGMSIQDAFPNMPRAEREMLISGVDSSCWDEFMAEPEPDPDDYHNGYLVDP